MKNSLRFGTWHIIDATYFGPSGIATEATAKAFVQEVRLNGSTNGKHPVELRGASYEQRKSLSQGHPGKSSSSMNSAEKQKYLASAILEYFKDCINNDKVPSSHEGGSEALQGRSTTAHSSLAKVCL